MSWLDQRTKGQDVKIANYLPSSQPKCKSHAHMYGQDAGAPRQDPIIPKGKRTTITLGKVGKNVDSPTEAQQRAIEFGECAHKLQRLKAKPDEMEQRSPVRCQQTSVTSIAHRDLAAGGIEAVLRRSGNDGSGSQSPSRGGSVVADGPQQEQQQLTSDDVPPLEVLADEGWTKPRIDSDALRDPYLRKEGLHINDAGVYSHISKRLVSSRSLTKAIVDKSVDFNFQYVRKV